MSPASIMNEQGPKLLQCGFLISYRFDELRGPSHGVLVDDIPIQERKLTAKLLGLATRLVSEHAPDSTVGSDLCFGLQLGTVRSLGDGKLRRAVPGGNSH